MNPRCLSLCLLSSLLALPSLVRAQEPPAPSYEGTFKNDELSLTLKKIGAADYAGSITAGGQEMPIDSAGVKGGQLSGHFKAPDGEKFPFFAVWKGGKVELTSEEVVHLLDPVAKRPNPLAKPAKPNPLAKPARPNPLERPKPAGDDPGEGTDAITSDDDADRPAVKRVTEAMDAGDHAQAWTLLGPLLEKGNVRAHYLAGLMYQNGTGVPKDGAKATAAYERSGAGGFGFAYDNAGVMYRDGNGVSPDPKRAAGYFEKAVNARIASDGAALNLGALYAEGQGVPLDKVRAYAYFQISNTDGARQNLAILEKKLAPQEIERAKALADEIRAQRPRYASDGPAPAAGGMPGGVPVTFAKRADGAFVVKTAPPADGDNDPFNDPPFATITVGDVLLEVDNKPVKGLTQAQLDAALAGEPESLIQLKLVRPDGGGVQVAAPRVAIMRD